MFFTYQTSRLAVAEVCSDVPQLTFLTSVTELLTPKVVENLPPYFDNIDSIADAKVWFKKMVPESRLFVVKHTKMDIIIGFVFVYIEHNTDAHVGYLLGESHWNKGYATELLQGLIDFVIYVGEWAKLIAGVDISNKVSSKLLLKLGFTEQKSENKDMLVYEYLVPETKT